MGYVNTQIENVLMVRWDNVTIDDTVQVAEWIRECHERIGQPLAYMAIVPADAPLPKAETRRGLLAGYDGVVSLCSTMRLVMLGTGFRKAALRAVSAGLLMAIKGKRYQVDDGIESAAEAAAENSSLSAEKIVQVARDAGIILDAELLVAPSEATPPA